MNKTIVTVAFFVLIFVTVLGSVAILLIQPATLDRFVSTVVVILAIATTGATTIYGLGKQGEQIHQIQKQTNGNTSRMQDQIDQLHELLAQSAALPGPPAATLLATLPDPAAATAAGSGNSTGRHA